LATHAQRRLVQSGLPQRTVWFCGSRRWTARIC
jgi:hypothetical protein